MGHRLGIINAFPREEHVKYTDNKFNNINGKFSDKNTQNKVENNYHKSNNNLKFTGMSDSFARTMDKIELGGFVVEFLLVDFIGMMVPRTYQAFMRNREELGTLNYKAGTEEAIRELLSGPSMTLMPIAALALAKKYVGPATQLDKDTLDKFTKIAREVINEENIDKSPEKIKEGFYKRVFDEITEPHRQVSNSDFAAEFETFKNSLNAIEEKQKYIAETLNKDRKAKYGYTFKKLISAPVEFIKRIKDPLYEYEGLSNTDHYKAYKELDNEKAKLTELISGLNKKYSIMPENSHKIHILKSDTAGIVEAEEKFLAMKKIGNITNDLVNYSKGVINKIDPKNDLEQSLKSLHDKARGGRKFTIVTTVLAVSSVLYYIPMLYKRNKQFPGIDGLVDQNTNLHANELSDKQGGK